MKQYRIAAPSRFARAAAALALSLAGPAAAVQVATSAGQLPAEFRQALAGLEASGALLQGMTVSNTGEWVIVGGGRVQASPGFPAEALQAIDRFQRDGGAIQAVAAQGPRWLVAADRLRIDSSGVPEEAQRAIRQLHMRSQALTSFALVPGSDDWVLTGGGGVTASRGAPRGLAEAARVAAEGEREITAVAVGGPDAWVLTAGSWFMSEGLPAEMLAGLEAMRADQRNGLDHVLLRPNGGWAAVSNGDARASRPADQIEVAYGARRTLYQRMAELQIPGLAISLVDGNRRVWTRTYGVRDAEQPESWVVPDTVFDAGSLAKPVSSVAVLQLVNDGSLDASTDYSTRTLRSAPALFRPRGAAGPEPGSGVTVPLLLSHCAGLGFQKQLRNASDTGIESFDAGTPVPTVGQVLVGQGPASPEHQVVRLGPAGASAIYSGVNHTLIQALMDETARGGFARQTDRLLAQLDMKSSGFAQPMPPAVAQRAAWGHRRGNRQERDVRPAAAAAGLWSSAPDLANFVIFLNNRGTFNGQRYLAAQYVDAMLGRAAATNALCANRQTESGWMALGIYVDPRQIGSRDEIFWHRGTQGGQRAYIFGLPQQGRGLAIMMSGGARDADAFAGELLGRIAAVYSLPSLPVR